MTIEELQIKRKDLWTNVRRSHKMLTRARKLLASIEKRYMTDEEAYEKCDRELAMLDGRYERVLAAQAAEQASKKSRVKADLTEEQIIAIAERLGIILPNV